uniref:Uncharacterized protein n=1 Tax=Panagrolaimus davidi TaxID=227884 RepID=A0A914PBG6_9BILA
MGTPLFTDCYRTFTYAGDEIPVDAVISNISNAVISLALGLSSALARRIKGNKWQQKQKYETYLLIQSIITTFILIVHEISVIYTYFYSINTDTLTPDNQPDYNVSIKKMALNVIIESFRMGHNISSVILLFTMS